MEIRKADSKGRVTGFEPGRYYEFVELDSHGGIVLSPIIRKEEVVKNGNYLNRLNRLGKFSEGGMVN